MITKKFTFAIAALMALLSIFSVFTEEAGDAPEVFLSFEEEALLDETLADETELELDGFDAFFPEELIPDETSGEEEGLPEAELDPVTQTIIGTDDRMVILNTQKRPYSAIGLMKVHASCGCSWSGTCFMVSPTYAMTAAHCIVCTRHGKTPDRMDIYFGYSSNGNCLYAYENKKITYWWGTNFKNEDGTYGYNPDIAQWDYAYMKFEERIGDKTGCFGWKVPKESNFNSSGRYKDLCYITGYRGEVLRQGSGYVYTDENYRKTQLYTEIDTVPGNSGCPVYDKDYNIIGILTSGDASYNYIRRNTASLYRAMNRNGAFSNASGEGEKEQKAEENQDYALEGNAAVLAKVHQADITTLVIPDEIQIQGISYPVTKIRASACKGLKSLKSVTIGKNVESIGKSAFQDCKKLKKLKIKTTLLTADTVGNNAFKNLPDSVTILCPEGQLSAYKKLLKKKGAPKSATYTE